MRTSEAGSFQCATTRTVVLACALQEEDGPAGLLGPFVLCTWVRHVLQEAERVESARALAERVQAYAARRLGTLYPARRPESVVGALVADPRALVSVCGFEGARSVVSAQRALERLRYEARVAELASSYVSRLAISNLNEPAVAAALRAAAYVTVFSGVRRGLLTFWRRPRALTHAPRAASPEATQDREGGDHIEERGV